MSDDLTWDLPTRLEEGRTNGSHLRWQVTPIHKEAAATIRQQQETIERLTKALEDIADGMGENATDYEAIGRYAPAVARAALENTND